LTVDFGPATDGERILNPFLATVAFGYGCCTKRPDTWEQRSGARPRNLGNIELETYGPGIEISNVFRAGFRAEFERFEEWIHSEGLIEKTISRRLLREVRGWKRRRFGFELEATS
jgi:hypothetical protein